MYPASSKAEKMRNMVGALRPVAWTTSDWEMPKAPAEWTILRTSFSLRSLTSETRRGLELGAIFHFSILHG
jgi:hypothetical protein